MEYKVHCGLERVECVPLESCVEIVSSVQQCPEMVELVRGGACWEVIRSLRVQPLEGIEVIIMGSW